MAKPLSSIKIRTKRLNGNTQIRLLITHPMQNGRHKDKQGTLIAAHYIQELYISHNEVEVINCHLSGGLSKNPYFDFLLKGGEVGDKIHVTWTDNLGKIDSNSQRLK